MALVDSIIGVESGGNPNAHLSIPTIDVFKEFRALSLVGELLFAGRPSAILGRVIAVHVNAINRMASGRFFAHVGQEVGEAIAPSLTNFDAARPVILIRDIFLVFAPRNHSEPSSVFRAGGLSIANAASRAMGCICRFRCRDLVTTAAFRIPRFEVWDSGNGPRPAITKALHLPNRRSWAVAPWLAFLLGNSGQFPKPHSNVILSGHM